MKPQATVLRPETPKDSTLIYPETGGPAGGRLRHYAFEQDNEDDSLSSFGGL